MRIAGHDIQVPTFDFKAAAEQAKQTIDAARSSLPSRDDISLSRAPKGASIGGEIFLGADRQMSHDEERGAESWSARHAHLSLGLHGAAGAAIGWTGAAAHASGELAAQADGEARSHHQLSGRSGWMNSTGLHAFLGARAEGALHAGLNGAGMGTELFVGAKAGITEQLGLTRDGRELLGGNGSVEGWAGFGAKAEAEADYDPNAHTVSAHGAVGAAFVLGMGGAASVTINPGAVAEAAREDLAK